MKTISNRLMILGIILVFSTRGVSAQSGSSDGLSAVPLSVYIEEQPALSAIAVSVLTQTLDQVASNNAMTIFPGYGRFCLTAVANAVTRDLLPGPPPQIAQNIDVTFYIVDNYEHKVFSSTTLSLKGVGSTDEKSFISAIRNIRTNDARLTGFAQKGRTAIVDYYNQQCDRIIREAHVISAAHLYEEALYALSAIPEQCTECYSRVIEAAQNIYSEYIDYQCQVNLAKARMAWAAEQNAQGAQSAGVYLGAILPEAACYDEAMALYSEIKGKVLDDWKFEMKQYQDAVQLESQRINAWKEVGVAYGNHQQPTDYHINWLVR